jgi:predicted metal-dependent HD superfamily phosphohydrolase
MYDLQELNRQWQKCWTDRSILKQQEIDLIFRLIITAYTEPHRHYHNLKHIHHVLNIVEGFRDRLHNPNAVLFAVWFHDFSYDPQASDNEIKSAKFAAEILTDIGESIELVDRVQQLILATQGHQIDAADFDRCVFLDADLAILGTDLDQYQTYSRSIRSEYSWVSDAAYQVGRIKVLESFLQRDRLYYTDTLFDRLESISRLNMQQEITFLLDRNS